MNMKKEWDLRASKNAYHFVSTFREEWDDDSFYRWGEIQTQAVIDKFFRDLEIDPSGLIVLEIGCGAGRMSRALASRFRLVHAYDVSDRYIQIAKTKNSHLSMLFFVRMMVYLFRRLLMSLLIFVFLVGLCDICRPGEL